MLCTAISQGTGQETGRQLDVKATYLAPGAIAPSDAPWARLTGDGRGNLTQAPAFLKPPVRVTLNGEKASCLAAGFPLELICVEMSPQGVRGGRRHIALADRMGQIVAEGNDYIEARSSGKHKKNSVTLIPGEGCVVVSEFEDKRTGTFHTQFDPGSYDGAGVYFLSGTFSYDRVESPFMGNSTWHGLANSGRFRITWVEDGGNLTLKVFDETRGVELPFSRYLDDSGWGFAPPGNDAVQLNRDLGVTWGGPNNVKTPREQRSLSLQRELPGNNTREFILYIDGQHWNFWREGGITMPRAGTEMVLTTAFGEWNADRTVFTQFPGPVYMGEKWLLELSEETGVVTENSAPEGSVEGIMLEAGQPMSCVTVQLNGGNVDEIRATKHDGLYSFAGISVGKYTIVPFKTGFTFEPAFREVVVAGGAISVEPFAALPLVDADTPGDTVTVAKIQMVRAPAGRFRIGQNGVATPLHYVRLDAFQIGAREITRRQYLEVMGNDPSSAGSDDSCPVEGVSWFDAARFCNRLSVSAGLAFCYDTVSWKCDFSRNGFRLPSEAEWEYACRAGSYTNFFPGCDESDLARVGWYGEDENSGGSKPAGGKNQNSWGIFDTHGNVAEWCNDWYGDYTDAEQENPSGPDYASLKVVRGGSWASVAFMCRSAFRDALVPSSANKLTGFRVVRLGK